MSKALGGMGVHEALGFFFPSSVPRDVWQRHFRIRAMGPSALWCLAGGLAGGPGGTLPCSWPAVLCSSPAHLVGLPRPVGCLQRLIQPLGHQHQEASHHVQGLCTVDFGLCDDRLGLGSAGGRESGGDRCAWNGPQGISILLRGRIYPDIQQNTHLTREKERKEKSRKTDLSSESSY